VRGARRQRTRRFRRQTWRVLAVRFPEGPMSSHGNRRDGSSRTSRPRLGVKAGSRFHRKRSRLRARASHFRSAFFSRPVALDPSRAKNDLPLWASERSRRAAEGGTRRARWPAGSRVTLWSRSIDRSRAPRVCMDRDGPPKAEPVARGGPRRFARYINAGAETPFAAMRPPMDVLRPRRAAEGGTRRAR